MQEHTTIRRDVRSVIEETNAAYSTFSEYNCTNSDFADFAKMAIGQFRNALRNQDLTREELECMLRDGLHKHRQKGDKSDWARFVASHIAKSSNANSALKN